MTTVELARRIVEEIETYCDAHIQPPDSYGLAKALVEAEEKMRRYIFRFGNCTADLYECNENRAQLIEFKEWLLKHA